MKSLKHIGRLKDSNAKVLVVFRTLPGEADHALVLPVSNLSTEDHDAIMNLIETQQAQDAFEFGEIMFIRKFSDSRNMLQAANADKLLMRIPTDHVIMTPNTNDEILLSELNVLIAEQKNCAIDDLYTFVSGASKVEDVVEVNDLGRDVGEPNVPEYQDKKQNEIAQAPVLSDEQIAETYRSQADTMMKEAQRLMEEAEQLAPTKKAPAKKKAAAAKKKAPAKKKPAAKKTTAKKSTKKKDAAVGE